MLNITDYCTSGNIWSGISSYVKDHKESYAADPAVSLSDDDILKILKSNAKEVLSPKDYDSFRKAVTSLNKGSVKFLKKENIYRLFFVLKLESDTQAHNLLLNYLHQNELSARLLDEFILIAALKLKLSWEETSEIRKTYNDKIAAQPIAPSVLREGDTAETYQSVIDETLRSREDLIRFLDDSQNLDFFAKTRNTQYLALFDDVELEVLYNADSEQTIRLITDYGSTEKETMLEYYHSLFGLHDDSSGSLLSDDEIASLCTKFDQVFMTYDNFCLLVQRKRPVDISSGTFLLSLFKKLLTEDSEAENDFYVNFLDYDEFTGVCNDILNYFGFPVLNPAIDSFDRLLLDIYKETLDENPSVTNSCFQKLYLRNIKNYIKQIANL